MFPILEAGWGVQSVQQFQQMTSLNGEFGGNKYFRFQMYDKWYFFKQNHSDTKRQQVSDDTELHSREYGVPTRKVLPTVDGKTHFKDKRTGFTYSVYEYIDGEHFDGSRIELLEAASNIATLHRALAALPISQEVDDTKEPFFHHNRELLLELLEKFNRPVFQPLIGKLSLTIEEIKEISLEVSRQLPTNLHQQVIHHDLHPHNMLFDRNESTPLAILDFEQIVRSQLLRDIALGMHRFARTHGFLTERQHDIGASLKNRAESFLDQYNKIRPHNNQELKWLITILRDECLDRVTIVLSKFVDKPSPQLTAELKKQLTLLKECELFSFSSKTP